MPGMAEDGRGRQGTAGDDHGPSANTGEGNETQETVGASLLTLFEWRITTAGF